MRSANSKTVLFALFFLCVVPGAVAQRTKHEKHCGRAENVWSYNGDVLFVTDGSLPNGICLLGG